MSVQITRLLCIFLLVGGSLMALPPAAAEGTVANVVFEAQIPAPTMALAASSDGKHVLVMDEEARFTFIPGLDEDEQVWKAPRTGVLSALGEAMGEVDPVPRGVAVATEGENWATTVAYEGEYGGMLWGFGRWSDQPIWSFDLTDGAREADQPTVLDAGGPYFVLGTEKGFVYVFRSDGGGVSEPAPIRVYKQDNNGNRFGAIGDVDTSRDGKRFLIGTAAHEKGSVHLYSNHFFMYSFQRITSTVQNVAISADGTRGAVVAGDGTSARLHYLDLTRGRTLWETTVGSDVPALALSEDGTILAAGTTEGHVMVFQERGLPTDRDPLVEHRFGHGIDSLSVADKGAIAVGTAGGELHFLAPERGVPLWSYDAGGPIAGALLSSDSELLVLSTRDQESGRVIFTAADHDIEHFAPPQPRLAPGVVNTVPIEIGNNGNRMETIRITWGALPEGWEGLSSNITVAPSETGTLNAKISVSKGQLPGTFPVPATLHVGPQSVPVALAAVVPEMTSGQITETWSLPAAVAGGAPAAYMLKIENTGNTVNEVTLGYAKLPSEWKAAFVGPTDFRLKPGEDRQVALKVWSPSDVPVGREIWLDVVAAWTHGEERVPLTVRVVDGPGYRALLSSESDKSGGGLLPAELEEESLKQQSGPKVESEDSPTIGVAFTIAVVAALAIFARRGRDRV